MKTHRIDLLALLFGLALLIAGAAFLPAELSDAHVDGAWVAAVSFVLLGVVALVATLTRGRHERDEQDEVEPSTETEPAS